MAGREKEGDSARMSARRGAQDREERWGKAARRGAVKAGHERRWGREERTPQDGQRGGGKRDIR